MKKYKLSSLFLVLTLTITSLFSNLSFSHAYNKNQGSKTTFNEYELLKQVNQEYTKSNKKQSLNLSNTVNNLSEKEIDMIVNYRETYSNKIYKLKEWKIEELEAVGYNNEQINAIKTFDGSEEKLVLASTLVLILTM